MDISAFLQDEQNNDEAREKLNKMLDMVSDTIKSVQNISAELRPSILDDLGLIPAIEWYCSEFENRTKIKCDLFLDTVVFKDIRKNMVVFRVLQESLTNIARHSKAKNVIVSLIAETRSTHIIIEDDGIGFLKEKLTSVRSLGLIGMQERIRQFNGTVKITSAHNKGTKIEARLPY